MWGRIYPHAVLLLLTNIILKASCKGSGSLTFVIDDTYSMHDDIAQVKRSVDDISDIVFNEKSSQIDNMVLVTFNDPDAGVRVITKNRQTFKSILGAVNVYGGGDCWEPSMKGLLLALEKSNRDSYIYVFTDASAKDYYDSHYVKEMCQKKQSRIVFVLTGHCGNRYDKAFDVYYDIAQACTGLAFEVPKNAVKEVLPTIKETIKGNQTVITTTILPAGVKKDIPFSIDDHTDYAIVSVSGTDVYLNIRGPSHHLEKIMWNNNGKVVKLSNVKPGTYVATVMGQSRTSVVIVGRTDFFFSHGFSELNPKSLADTSLQPIAESKVHLSISVTDEHRSVQIVSAQLLDMDEKPISDPMPLTETSKNFYVTHLFVAPSQRFKVAVNGIIKATGKPIIRIGKIPITPPEPPKKLPDNTRPIVKIAEGKAIEIEYNSTVTLTCNVVAYPKPKIEWANMNGHVMPSKMAVIEEPYKYISYMDISYASKGDGYRCYATNNIGRDETTINVIVKDPFTIKSTPPGKLKTFIYSSSIVSTISIHTYINLKKLLTEITKLTYGTRGIITCDIVSHLPLDTHWYYVNETTGQTTELDYTDDYEVSISRTQLRITEMDLDLVGTYVCKFSLKNKKDVQISFQTQVKIDGLVAPKIQRVPKIKVTKGKTAVIECKVESGVPPPKITWFFRGKLGSTFTPIITSESVLRIRNVDTKHEGEYKCVAMNNLGSDEHVTTLIIEYAPVIVTNSTSIEGIEGDLALRIPCDVVGVPKPKITWKLKGATITVGAKYSIEDGALVIMKPTEKDTSSYTCEAKNHISSASVTFQVNVNKYLKSSGTVHYVYLKQGETKKLQCEAYNSKSQSVKWFITRKITQLRTTTSHPDFESTTTWSKDAWTTTRTITQEAGNEEYIQVANASALNHDGNYTCHVSDKHGKTQTHTYVVDVGNAPVFAFDVVSLTNWKGDISDITQNCDVSSTKPKPDVQWTFNGKVLTNLSSAGLGHYTCNVSNVHGYVLKQFDVKSSVCLIKRNLQNSPYTPLVLNDERFWHELETTEYYTIVNEKMKITLSCPSQKETSNSFKTFPKKSTLEAICYKEDSFIVDDKTYKFSDLQCTDSIQPSVIKTKVKCSTETSELIRVGYNVPGFLEAYEVCFDHKSNMPSYTRSLMSITNDGLNGVHNWYTHPGIGSKQTERGFTCKDASSSCCYSKSQLVNAVDFNDGPAKKSTFLDPLNVIPAWMPCDTSKSSWKGINNMVRTQLPNYIDIAVWSGTHTLQEKNGAAIPRYLWKVVRLTDAEAMAIVHVNDPNPTKSDIKCKTPAVCDKYEDWLKTDDSTYCCSLPDFLKSFDILSTDIGETMKAVLNKIKT
ncbi:hypothetical protein PYW07_006337 [Mythimna separata]|uniref:Hemolin n=1 Tax=Mythimna separata TaxID=271217 RepID=A0AAD7YUB3_MYTSE|nr:hypothetical protein PYW07_006337 [Mythimna separata]